MRAKVEGSLQHIPTQKLTRGWPGGVVIHTEEIKNYSKLIPRCLQQKTLLYRRVLMIKAI